MIRCIADPLNIPMHKNAGSAGRLFLKPLVPFNLKVIPYKSNLKNAHAKAGFDAKKVRAVFIRTDKIAPA